MESARFVIDVKASENAYVTMVIFAAYAVVKLDRKSIVRDVVFIGVTTLSEGTLMFLGSLLKPWIQIWICNPTLTVLK